MRVVGSVLAKYIEAETVVFTVGEEKVSWEAIWMVYLAAPATSDQSNTIVWPGLKRASTAGLRSEGAGKLLVAAGLTVSMAVRLTPL